MMAPSPSCWTAKGVAVGNVVVDVAVETRNKAHYEEMVAALKANGYTI